MDKVYIISLVLILLIPSINYLRNYIIRCKAILCIREIRKQLNKEVENSENLLMINGEKHENETKNNL
jgi:hypothetical protein